MRLFVALPLCRDAVVHLQRLRLRLSSPGDGLRWSEAEQWHITLQFYGEVVAERAECLQAEMERLGTEWDKEARPEIAMNELGMFTTKGILLATVDLTGPLLHLQEEVVRVSTRCGVLPESRAFRPHVTLARSKGKSGFQSLQRMSGGAGLPAFGPEVRWRAEEMVLLESRLTPRGAEYGVKARIGLGRD